MKTSGGGSSTEPMTHMNKLNIENIIKRGTIDFNDKVGFFWGTLLVVLGL